MKMQWMEQTDGGGIAPEKWAMEIFSMRCMIVSFFVVTNNK